MHIQLHSYEANIFKKIATKAEHLGIEAWVIGGIVRYKLLERPTKDINIVCTGDGIALAQAAATLFNPKPQVSFFKNFGTAHFKIADIDIEFVGARKESYSRDSRKPQVESGTIADDQLRRDFTINALAILPASKPIASLCVRFFLPQRF